MNNFELRPYQRDIVNQVINSDKSTLIQVPTGGGKTVIAHEIIKQALKEGLQILFVAPTTILMDQAYDKFKDLSPFKLHGNMSWNVYEQLLVSTIQTAHKITTLNVDIVIFDEIHYGFDGIMIEKLMQRFRNRFIGLSATPYDKNGEKLKGFDLVIDKYDLKYMVQNNYLVNMECYRLTKIENLDTIKITAGDYNIKELGTLVADNQTIMEIVNSTKPFIDKYNKVIVFAVDINHAEMLNNAYKSAGYKAEVVHSGKKQECEYEIHKFINGEIKILINVAMLTTGFDVPQTDVVVLARPTKSQNLYKQMIGRALRPYKNKKNAVLLDCGNVIDNLGMPFDPIKPKDIVVIQRNKQICPMCGNHELKLKKNDSSSYWFCDKCKYIKIIDNAIYQCMYCKKKHQHGENFEFFNDSIFLVCSFCRKHTLISKARGDECFIKIETKSLPSLIPNGKDVELFLPFEEARNIVRKMNLSKNDWKQLVHDVANKKRQFRDDIPMNPHIVYQHKGWIDTTDWLNSNLPKKITNVNLADTLYHRFLKANAYASDNKLFDFFNSAEDDYERSEIIDIFVSYSKFEIVLKIFDILDFSDEYITIESEYIKDASINKLLNIYNKNSNENLLDKIFMYSSDRYFFIKKFVAINRLDLASKYINLPIYGYKVDYNLIDFIDFEENSIECLKKILKLYKFKTKEIDILTLYYRSRKYGPRACQEVIQILGNNDIEVIFKPEIDEKHTKMLLGAIMKKDDLSWFELFFNCIKRSNHLNYMIDDLTLLDFSKLHSASRITDYLVTPLPVT